MIQSFARGMRVPFFTALLGLTILPAQAKQATAQYNDAYINEIATHYLDSHGELQPSKPKEAVPEPGFLDNLKANFLGRTFEITESSEFGKREAYECMLKAAPLAATGDQCIDANSIKKLDIAKGSEDPTASFINAIAAHTKTRNGTIGALSLIVRPTSNIKTLKARGACMRELVQNEKLRQTCLFVCESMAKIEEGLLEFEREEDPGSAQMYKHAYFGDWTDKILGEANKNWMALEASMALADVGTAFLALPTITRAMLGSAGITKAMKFFTQDKEVQGINTWHQAKKSIPYTYDYLRNAHRVALGGDALENVHRINEDAFATKNEWNDQSQSLKDHLFFDSVPGRATAMGLVAFDALGIYRGYKGWKFRSDLSKHLQGKMIPVATYLRGMKNLYLLASTNPTLKDLPCLADLKNLLNPKGKHSAKLAKLVQLLSTRTFTGNPSAFSLRGRALAAYKLMREVHSEFAAALRAAGEIEAYAAAAELLAQSANNEARYCLVDFVEGDAPRFELEGFWNPFVGSQKAVINDIAFGGTHGMRSMILTGPNTGGKSTMLKGAMLSALLAQTFGFTSAHACTMTPFSKMICHLNIADDTAGGISLFKAEVLRAQELMDTLRKLPKDQFAFVIVDEIFTATSPDQAEKLAYDFIKSMSEFRNCIFIDATHFKNITNLAKENPTCRNYHMEALVEHGMVTTYTYKLKEGVSPVQNAAQVAQEVGIRF